MSEETLKLILAAAIAVCEIYAMDPTKFPIFAWFWDLIATLCGELANILGAWSVKARVNYFDAVRSMS